MREKIIRVATEQIKRYGLRRFTIEDIASNMGISKKTVYKYFESKRQIISAVMENHLEMEKHCTLEALKIGGSWLDKLNAVMFCHVQDQPPADLLEELQRFFPEEWDKTESLSELKREQIKDLLSQGIKNEDIRSDINPLIIELALDKTLRALYDYNFFKQHDMTFDQAMEEVKKVILYGILKRD